MPHRIWFPSSSCFEGGPGIFHVAQPENVRAFDDQAVGPDFDLAINFDGLPHDEPVDDAECDETRKIKPHILNRRVMINVPAFTTRRRRPGEDAPERVPEAYIKVLVDYEDAPF